tara:strand:- start:592 stop:1761 length:1170 start_codon:yes stop_codon:yes gene_type:complete
MKPTFLSYILISTILFGCTQKRTEPINLESLPKLVKIDNITLKLDSTTVTNSENSIEYFTDKGHEYLAKFNKPDQSIKVFSLESGEVAKNIQMSTTGPNALIDFDGVPNRFKIISMDSIIVYNGVKSELVLINSKAEILKKWEVTDRKIDPDYPVFPLDTYSKIIINEHGLILSGNISWSETGLPPLALIKWHEDKVSQTQIPDNFEIYNQYPINNIGTMDLFTSSNTTNNQHEILVSYALDHRILILDKDLKVSYKELRNPRLGELKIYGKDIRKINPMTENALYDHVYSTGVYHSIIYDPYRNIYYRISRIPVPVKEFSELMSKGIPFYSDYSVIAYDEHFNPIGESTFNNSSLDHRMIFVSKKGLNIKNYPDNEDLLTFTTFVLDK